LPIFCISGKPSCAVAISPVFKYFGSLYKSSPSYMSLLGDGSAANSGIYSPHGLVVIGEQKFFSVPFLNLIFHEMVPFSYSLKALTL
jgi:hypothetical protein